MGEWMDIIIDDQLPRKYHAKVKDNEYWVPLVEKGLKNFENLENADDIEKNN